MDRITVSGPLPSPPLPSYFFSLSISTVRRTRLSTVGDQAFPVAAACTWNSLPQHVTSIYPLCLFSEDAWRLFSSGVPFLDSLPQLLLCLRSDCRHFRTLLSFFLLTYLLTYSPLSFCCTLTLPQILCVTLRNAISRTSLFKVVTGRYRIEQKKTS